MSHWIFLSQKVISDWTVNYHKCRDVARNVFTNIEVICIRRKLLRPGKEVVKRSIDSELAVDALINLIKENGDWAEPVKN